MKTNYKMGDEEEEVKWKTENGWIQKKVTKTYFDVSIIIINSHHFLAKFAWPGNATGMICDNDGSLLNNKKKY